MNHSKEFLIISDFVDDHFANFGFYPAEVETEKQVYTFDQYWAILDAGGYDEKTYTH